MRAFDTHFRSVRFSIRRSLTAGVCLVGLVLVATAGLALHLIQAEPAQARLDIGSVTYTTDHTWTRANSPYVINGTVTVAAGATLTIEPGVVVKLNGQLRTIRVLGTLKAVGTADQRIVFTSYQDDAVAGDTNADGAATAGAAGQWWRIEANGQASTASELKHVTVRYGGGGSGVYSGDGALYAYDGAKITATQSLFEHNKYYAVRAASKGTCTTGSCVSEISVNSAVLFDNAGGVVTLNAVGHLRNSLVYANRLRGAFYQLTTAYRGPASEVMDSDITENTEEGVHVSVDETSTAQVPTEHWPHGNRNNIWQNNQEATVTSPVQLYGKTARRAVDWKENFWGKNAAFGENTDDACTDAGYPGRLRYPAQGEDPDEPSPVGVGPIRHRSDWVTANGVTALCYYDYFGVGPNEFKKDKIDHDVQPPIELDPRWLEDIYRTFFKCVAAFSSGAPHALTPIECLGDPVHSATGNFTHSAVDVELPGIGVPFAFERGYNSLDTRDGPLGRGWTHGYDISLVVASNGDVEFRGEHGQRLQYEKRADGSYGDTPGVRSGLEKTADGYKLTRTDQVVYAFDNGGNLTSLRDRNGQGLSFTHTSGKLTGITDGAGRAITLSYNTAGKLSEVAVPDGRTTTYGYTNGLLTSATDPRGKTTTYTYDAGQRLATEVDANNHTVFANTYGTDGRVIEQVDALGKKTTFAWDPATETATATDARGNKWKDVYSNRVLVARIDPLGNTTTYGYDADYNRTSETDPRGNTATTTYDARGNVLTTTAPAPLSYEQTFTYNTRNDLTAATDGRGNTTTFGYDVAGNLTSTTEPGNGGAGFTTEFGRDPAGTGLLKSVTDPRGKTTTFDHDAAGNLTSVNAPSGAKETRAYDQGGRLTSRVSPRGNVQGANPDDYKTTYTYNARDALTGVTNPLGHVWSFGYDDAGNRTSRTDPKNRTTTWAYDAANRLKSVTAPDSAATSYGYDEIGNIISRKDANNHTTTWTYDSANRLASEVSPAGDTYTYGYDKAGNLTQVIDANGNATTSDTSDGITTYGYDALNRRTTLNYSDQTPDVTYAYDGNGNRTQMTDGAGTETYSYDPRNNLTSVTRGADVFSYTYDPARNVASRTYPDGRVTSYTYNDDGKLTTAASDGQTTSYTYDQDGNLSRTELPSSNGHVETRTYDRAGRLTELMTAKSGTTLWSGSYTYDSVGNPTAVTTSDGPINYTYDAQDRITEACYAASCTGASDPFIRYAYDNVGNRTEEVRPSGTTSYAYDEADRLLGSGNDTTGEGKIYTFDRNGNQTAAGQRTFSYDLADRLKSTTNNGVSFTYTYDGDGKRLTSSVGIDYLWDIVHPEPQVAIGARTYMYGLGRIAMHSGANTFYYHHDAVGSVTNVTSASGAKEWSYTYEPFGSLRSATMEDPNGPFNEMGFAGEMSDELVGEDIETLNGLGYHLRARQYDPDTGRFLSADPLPHPASDPYANTYHYARNRPTVMVDPSGMGPIWLETDGSDLDICSVTLDGCPSDAERVRDAVGGTLLFLSGAVVAGGSAAGAAECVANPVVPKLVCIEFLSGAGLGVGAMGYGLDKVVGAVAGRKPPVEVDVSPCGDLGVFCRT